MGGGGGGGMGLGAWVITYLVTDQQFICCFVIILDLINIYCTRWVFLVDCWKKL